MARVSMSDYSEPKRLPKAYKARDAAYMVGGNHGRYIASLPRKYKATPQQLKVKTAAQTCNIHKGMTKAELQKTMKNCVGRVMHGLNPLKQGEAGFLA